MVVLNVRGEEQHWFLIRTGEERRWFWTGTRIGVMAADMWWRIWIRIGGEYVVVVYGNSDDDDAEIGRAHV